MRNINFTLITTRFSSTLRKTALYDLHVRLGAKMVPYAGYSMPILYDGQTHIESHNWTRNKAGLFDVSHMLQSRLTGSYSGELLERLTPTDFDCLPEGKSSVSALLNENGGIVDDTVITKEGCNDFYIVTNAGCADKVRKYFPDQIKQADLQDKDIKWEPILGKALLALQGPQAYNVLKKELKAGGELSSLYFSERRQFELTDGSLVGIARGGYTGEDGFEISIDDDRALNFAESLLNNDLTKPIGLAARDSLRMEAGMCLYGNELNENITPVEANLRWIISKSKRNADLKTPFNGSAKIINQLLNKDHDKIRIGFQYAGKGPAARNGCKIYSKDGESVGFVSSGSASPSLNNINIGQAYVIKSCSKIGTELSVEVRKKMYKIRVTKMPFIPTHYYKRER